MESKELVYQRTRCVVRKSAANGEAKLVDEITWLLNLPSPVAAHFPRVLLYSLQSHHVYYYMPFYELPTLRTLLFEGLQLNQAESIMDKIVAFLFNELYPIETFDAANDHFRKTHIARAKQRLHEAKNESEYFTKLLAPSSLVINDAELENLPGLLKRCERAENLCRRLMPPKLYFVHGDLHFDNMLVDLSAEGTLRNFVLIDPRGFHGGEDIAYDLGKLWHSFHGCYDHIIYDRFLLKEDWVDRSKPSFRLAFTDYKLRELYSNVGRMLEAKLGKIILDDSDWKFRTRFAEALHFASLAPFHIGKEQRAKALYIIAVQLLSECLKDADRLLGRAI